MCSALTIWSGLVLHELPQQCSLAWKQLDCGTDVSPFLVPRTSWLAFCHILEIFGDCYFSWWSMGLVHQNSQFNYTIKINVDSLYTLIFKTNQLNFEILSYPGFWPLIYHLVPPLLLSPPRFTHYYARWQEQVFLLRAWGQCTQPIESTIVSKVSILLIRWAMCIYDLFRSPMTAWLATWARDASVWQTEHCGLLSSLWAVTVIIHMFVLHFCI